MTGGHRAKSVGAFKDDDVRASIEKINENIASSQSRLATLDKAKKENEERINRLREFKATLEGDIIKTEKSLHLDTSDLDSDKDFKKQLDKRGKELEKDMETLAETQSGKTRDLAP